MGSDVCITPNCFTKIIISFLFFALSYLADKTIKCGIVYLSIYEIYIAPLQGNYSGALPAHAQAKISFKELVKRAGQIPWKKAEFRWETSKQRDPQSLCCLMAVRARGT